MDLNGLTIDSARTAVQECTTTALALAEAHYARIQQEDGLRKRRHRDFLGFAYVKNEDPLAAV